jgi:3-oxoacyl-[acyl-carrier protein] reductase
MKKLDGQIVIVTGGARGIGEGICKLFCDEGAIVFLWDILEDGQNTADNISKNGGSIIFQKVDVSNQDSVNSAVQNIVENHGKIDVLINNAGIIRDRSILKMTRDDWDTVQSVNVDSLFITTKAVLPIMKASNYGRIISASSINAFQGAFGQTNYSASKAAIVGFTHSLCREVGKYNITVNAVAPGFIKSEMTDSMPEEIIKSGIAQIPVGRIGTPEDMAHAYLFLASKEAGFVSGHTLHANGGAMPF